MKIYLLRHGETDWNIEGRFQGHKDIPMNENGIRQIENSMEVLSSMVTDVDVILSSPLMRAKKSAEIAADRMGYPKEEIIIEPLFIERGFGEAEGQASKEVWNESVIASYAGAELKDEVCDRAENALQKVIEQYSGRTVLIAAHGAILKAVIAAVLGRQEVYDVRNMTLESGCVHLLQNADGAWKVYKCDMRKAVFTEV